MRKTILVILISLNSVGGISQSINDIQPYLSAGLGITAYYPFAVNEKLSADKRATGNIPLALTFETARNHYSFTFFVKRHFPSLAYSYSYVTPEGINNNLFFFNLNVFELSGSITYGRKIPVEVFRNNFNIIPKAGLTIIYFNEFNGIVPLSKQPFSNTVNPADTLNVSIKSAKVSKTMYFISPGLEIDTKLINKIRLYWSIFYNINISESLQYDISYSTNSIDETASLNFNLNHLQMVIGLKIPI